MKQIIHPPHTDSEILPCRIIPQKYTFLIINSSWGERTISVVKVIIAVYDVSQHVLEALRVGSHPGKRHLGELFRVEIETHVLKLIDHQLLGNIEY